MLIAGQPTINAISDPYINDNDPVAPVEHESIPTLSILEQNRNAASTLEGFI